MPLFSVNKLAEITGKQRETIRRKLDGVPHDLGGGQVKPAKLYDSKVALEFIYLGRREDDGDDQPARPITIQEAARDLSVARKAEIDLKMEVLRKERIPLEDVTAVNEEVHLHVAALLKTHTGKVLTEELVNDIFASLREIGAKVKELTE